MDFPVFDMYWTLLVLPVSCNRHCDPAPPPLPISFFHRYSHHIQADYITNTVKNCIKGATRDPASCCADFMEKAAARAQIGVSSEGEGGGVDGGGGGSGGDGGEGKSGGVAGRGDAVHQLKIKVGCCHIRQNPQYTIAALQEGVYVIGMKDQFNIHDLPTHPLRDEVQYIADDMGFVLYSRDDAAAGDGSSSSSSSSSSTTTTSTSSTSSSRSVDSFGPYFIEQYILMEVLSKQEVAQNVLEYYVNHKKQLQASLANYSEAQGKGFICWRFLMNEAVKAARAAMAEEAAGGGAGGGARGGAVPMDEEKGWEGKS
jgi:thiazolylpeptide-type bacteriocin precursor